MPNPVDPFAPPPSPSTLLDGTEISSATSYTLATGEANLVLTGTAAIDGTGNALDNVLVGNGAANVLTGNGGNDTLAGMAGDDILVGGAGDDTLTGGTGADVFQFAASGNGSDALTDFSDGDSISLPGVTLAGPIAAGTGAALANGAIEYSTANGVTTLYIGTNATVGADVTLLLAGNFAATQLRVSGSAIFFNNAPTLANALPDGSGTQGSAFSYQIAANVFADADAGDALTYTASLANGNGLPGWLNFSAASRTFSGTPGESGVGAITIRVTATDQGGVAVSDDFVLSVVNGNDAPTGSVMIGGTVALGETLTATHSLADADGLGSIDYQWQTSTNGSTWANLATGNSYVLTQAQFGQQIRVQASYVDGHGTPESVLSSATQAVGAAISYIVGTNGAETLSVPAGAGNSYVIIGMDGNDTLNGGASDDLLDGGAGADTMSGGAGNDTYIVDSWQDRVVEAANGGTDTVQANLHEGGISRFFNRLFSWVGLSTQRQIQVADNVENYSLNGNFAAAVTGNALDNRIVGNAENNTLNGGTGNDVLIGGGGRDTLTGGAGADTFVIDRVAAMVATINDFTAGTDHIGLSPAGFGDLFSGGTLNASVLGNATTATTSAIRLYYSQAQGALYYDADGNGLMSSVQIASFAANAKPASLAATDFVLAG